MPVGMSSLPIFQGEKQDKFSVSYNICLILCFFNVCVYHALCCRIWKDGKQFSYFVGAVNLSCDFAFCLSLSLDRE